MGLFSVAFCSPHSKNIAFLACYGAVRVYEHDSMRQTLGLPLRRRKQSFACCRRRHPCPSSAAIPRRAPPTPLLASPAPLPRRSSTRQPRLHPRRPRIHAPPPPGSIAAPPRMVIVTGEDWPHPSVTQHGEARELHRAFHQLGPSSVSRLAGSVEPARGSPFLPELFAGSPRARPSRLASSQIHVSSNLDACARGRFAHAGASMHVLVC